MDKELVIKIESKLKDIRGCRVMLDRDLAEYYGVDVRVLNQAVKRNEELFPDDFMFQLSDKETARLKSEGSLGKNLNVNPLVFTEKGAWAAAFIFKSDKARQKGIQLIRILEKLRDFAASHVEELTGETRHLLESKTAVTNIYYGPVTQTQIHGNQNNINIGELVLDLVKLKDSISDPEVKAVAEKVASQVAAGQKNAARQTIKDLTDVAKMGTVMYKFGVVAAKIIGTWLGH